MGPKFGIDLPIFALSLEKLFQGFGGIGQPSTFQLNVDESIATQHIQNGNCGLYGRSRRETFLQTVFSRAQVLRLKIRHG